MSLICNKGGTLLIENKTCGLSACRKGDLHGAFLAELEDVAVGGDCEKGAFAVFSGAVEGHGGLEKSFVVCWLHVRHI